MKNMAEGVFTVAVTKGTSLNQEAFDAKYEEMEYEVELFVKFPDGSKEKFDVTMYNFRIDEFYPDEE